MKTEATFRLKPVNPLCFHLEHHSKDQSLCHSVRLFRPTWMIPNADMGLLFKTSQPTEFFKTIIIFPYMKYLFPLIKKEQQVSPKEEV